MADLVVYTPAERAEVQRVFSAEIGMPWEEIYNFLQTKLQACYLGTGSFSDGSGKLQDIYTESARSKSSRKKDIASVSPQMRAAICDVYQHDDLSLRDMAYVFVVIALEKYIWKLVAKITRGGGGKESLTTERKFDLFQMCVTVIGEHLPAYNAKYALTTFFDPYLRHEILKEANARIQLNRGDRENAVFIKKCELEYREDLGIPETEPVSREALRCYANAKNPNRQLSVEAFRRADDAAKEIEPLTEEMAAVVPDSVETPEEAVIQQSEIEAVHDVIDTRMSDTEQLVMNSWLALFAFSDDDVTPKEVIHKVHEKVPTMTELEISKALTSGMNKLREANRIGSTPHPFIHGIQTTDVASMSNAFFQDAENTDIFPTDEAWKEAEDDNEFV